MRHRKSFHAVCVVATMLAGVSQAMAGDWTIAAGGTYPISGQIGAGAALVAGDSILVTGTTNTDPVTIQIDSALIPSLGDAAGPALSITAVVAVTIEFSGSFNVPLGNAANTSIVTNAAAGGSVSVTNAGGATGAFYFSGNTNKILTIDGPISGTDAVNKFVIGNNTLRTQTNAVTLNDVSIGGANAKIDADIATNIDTLTVTSGAALDVDIASGLTVTVDDATTLSGASNLEIIAVAGGGFETLAFTAGLTLEGTSTLMFTNDTGAVTGGVTANADGVTLDVNGTASIDAVTMTAGQGDMTLKLATGKVLTTTIDVNDNTLTLDEAAGGQVSTVTLDTPGGIINVDENCTITTITQTASSATIDLAADKTLTATNGADMGAAKTLVLQGTGTISQVLMNTAGDTLTIAADVTITTFTISAAGVLNINSEVTWTHNVDTVDQNITLGGTGTLGGNLDVQTGAAATRTVTVASGADVTVTTLTTGLAGAAKTLLFACTGDLTITNLVELPGAGDKIQKTGAGTLTLTPGITTSFANGVAVLLDIDAGTVIIGASGASDDVTFNDDGDQITVASGATLTTFGSFAVGVAGANVNLDAAIGSIVNLNSAGGAENLTAADNNDFQLLGTVNIDGANGDYTLGGGAFIFQLGTVNINTNGSLICTTNDAAIEFVAGSTVNMAGSATLTLGSATDGNEVVLDTIGDTGTFTLDRNSSANLTLNHLDLSRAVYASNTGCPAQADSITTTNVDFTTGNSNWTGACPGLGGGDGGGAAVDDGDDGDGGVTTEATAGDDGTAAVSDSQVTVSLAGLVPGMSVALQTNESGASTVTIGNATAPDLVLTVAGVGTGANLDVSIDDQGDPTVVVTRADGSKITLNLNSIPQGSHVGVSTDDNRNVTVTVTDTAGDALDVAIEVSGTGSNVVFTITYNDSASGSPAGHLVSGFAGMANEQSLGGSVTISATGLSEDSVATVALTYQDADLAGIDESELRLFKLDASSNTYAAAGTNDKGDSAPTGVLGDYGVDTSLNSAWAEVSSLGRFAIGVPPSPTPTEETTTEEVLADTETPPVLCGLGVAPLSAAGLVNWLLMITGLLAIRHGCRRR